MRKTKSIFALGLVLLSTSFVSKDSQPGTALYPGSSFPRLTLTQVDSSASTTLEFTETYTLVQFWGAYQPTSRLENARLSNTISQHGLSVELISVGMDPVRSICEESARIDGTPRQNLYYPQGDERTALVAALSLDKELSNYLMDSRGVIVAKNITPKELTQLKQ